MEEIAEKIAIIGAGTIGSAIARGLVVSGASEPSRLSASAPSEASRQPLARLGIATYASNIELLAADPEVLVLAVKPQVLQEVLEEIAPLVGSRLVISIAAGITIDTLEEALPDARVIRAMPNLPIQVLSGATAVCPGSRATQQDLAVSLALFSALGVAKAMREDQLDAEGAVVGCGPAYVALFADALTRAGIEAGLAAADCREMVLATMQGVAEQLRADGEHPRAYMEKVTSPGGTTAAGLHAMEPLVEEAAWAATDAALVRTRELAKG